MVYEFLSQDLRPGELQVVLDGERLFDAADVAAILSALSSDYRAAYPDRRLIVTSLETGSLSLTVLDVVREIAPYVKEAAVLATDAKSIVDFGKTLRDEFKRKRKQPAPEPKQSEALLPHKSVEKIAEIASKSGRNLYLRQRSADGGEMELHLTDTELEHVHRIEVAEKRLRRTARRRLTIAEPELIEDMREAVHQLATIELPEASTLIRAMAMTLDRHERTRYLTRLAAMLREQGHPDLSDLVIRQIQRVVREG